jgi:hypothetical protein
LSACRVRGTLPVRLSPFGDGHPDRVHILSPKRSFEAALSGAALAAILAAAMFVAPASLAANGDCAQPVSNGSAPTAVDCAYVLKSAVGALTCDLCICDVNGNGSKNTTDALVCLKKAVGQSIGLQCPPCDGVTTTTVKTGPGESTTSTSTTSTTTTIPVNCSSNGDCSGLPAEFRCNPNLGQCEKPCTRNADCHDFYTCNTTTQYCQEPALLF